jgi:hypothetical protein
MIYFDSLETGACFENELLRSTLQLESKYIVLSGYISYIGTILAQWYGPYTAV